MADPSLFIPPLVMDLAIPQRLYYGTNRVYQTVDGASNWTDISGNLAAGVLTSIAVAPSDSNTVYATTGNGKIFVTHNAGAGAANVNGWANVTNILPNRYFTSVQVHPANANIAYLTVSGFSGFSGVAGHIFKTTTGGSSWTDVSGNLPNTPANDIQIDPDFAGTLYAATDVGVFKSTNDGGSWLVAGDSLPLVVVTALKLHRASRKLRAATHGRGIWELNTTAPLQVTIATSPAGLTLQWTEGRRKRLRRPSPGTPATATPWRALRHRDRWVLTMHLPRGRTDRSRIRGQLSFRAPALLRVTSQRNIT